MKKKLLIFNESTIFNDYIPRADFINNMKILEKLSETGFSLALVSSYPEPVLLKIAHKKGVEINRIFKRIHHVDWSIKLEKYLGDVIDWGKRKKIELAEMVYFGYCIHPDYSATIVADRIDFIGVLINNGTGDVFNGCMNITADKKIEARNLWQFLPTYLEMAEELKEI